MTLALRRASERAEGLVEGGEWALDTSPWPASSTWAKRGRALRAPIAVGDDGDGLVEADHAFHARHGLGGPLSTETACRETGAISTAAYSMPVA